MSIRYSLLILRPDPTEGLVVQNSQQVQEVTTADLINVQSSIVPADVSQLQEISALVVIFDTHIVLEDSSQLQISSIIKTIHAKGLMSINIILR